MSARLVLHVLWLQVVRCFHQTGPARLRTNMVACDSFILLVHNCMAVCRCRFQGHVSMMPAAGLVTFLSA